MVPLTSLKTAEAIHVLGTNVHVVIRAVGLSLLRDVVLHLVGVREKVPYSLAVVLPVHITVPTLDRTMRLPTDSEDIPTAMATGLSFLADERSTERTCGVYKTGEALGPKTPGKRSWSVARVEVATA